MEDDFSGTCRLEPHSAAKLTVNSEEMRCASSQ